MIELVRVDDRLIHGQVAIGWSAATGANTILVVNDAAQADKTQAMALKMGTPAGMTLYVRGLDESGEIVQKFAAAEKARVMVILKSISDAAALVESSGGAIRSLNIGGQRAGEGLRKLTDHTYASDEDVAKLRELHEQGIEIDLRMLPRDTARSFDQAVSQRDA